jgi:hypothetical protein
MVIKNNDTEDQEENWMWSVTVNGHFGLTLGSDINRPYW